MNAITLLEDLKRRGFVFKADGSKVHFQGTMEPLTPELLETLKKHKREILEYVTLADEGLCHELELAGVPEKWRLYLLERLNILVQYEGYTTGQAIEEVHNMAKFYKNLN